VGPPQRIQLGIVSSDPQQGAGFVSYGTVDVSFSFLGADGSGAPRPGPSASAKYIPAYGLDDSGTSPALTTPSTSRGVYEADVSFDQPGIWQAELTFDLPALGPQRLTAALQVAARPAYPAPGQPAPRTDSLIIGDKGVPATAIDSLAVDGRVPDPALHRWTVARAVAEHRPVLLIVGTPAHCTSLFCGPETNAVADLAARYDDRAVFIHIETWKRYPNVVNRAAAAWTFHGGDLTDPWTFLIGADGRIVDRWMPLFDPQEIASQLEPLPPMASTAG
jgi:hypothetical protein